MAAPSITRIALALALALTACGSKAHPQTYHVEIRGMQFVPAELTVNLGDTVVWTNDDVVPHTVTLHGVLESLDINSKQHWEWMANMRGDLPYNCTYHPMMRGKLIVQ